MSHKINGFGVLTISQRSRQAETAVLVINKSLAKKNIHLPVSQFKITTAPPAWKPQQTAETLGELTSQKIDADLVFPKSLLNKIFQSLTKSTPVMISSLDNKPIRIQFQPYSFKESYKQYQSCTAQLIGFTFDQITRNTLYYQVDEKELSSANKAILNKIVRYMQADPNRILGVIVDGHSDVQSDPAVAESLAKNHADWVAEYLKAKGVAEDKLNVRSHGDKYPVANNFLLKDRAKNRRITVRLEDESIRKKNADKVALLKKQAEEIATSQSSSSASSLATGENSSAPDFGDKLPIELELERMTEGQDFSEPSPSEMPK